MVSLGAGCRDRRCDRRSDHNGDQITAPNVRGDYCLALATLTVGWRLSRLSLAYAAPPGDPRKPLLRIWDLGDRNLHPKARFPCPILGGNIPPTLPGWSSHPQKHKTPISNNRVPRTIRFFPIMPTASSGEWGATAPPTPMRRGSQSVISRIIALKSLLKILIYIPETHQNQAKIRRLHL